MGNFGPMSAGLAHPHPSLCVLGPGPGLGCADSPLLTSPPFTSLKNWAEFQCLSASSGGGKH